MPIIATTAPTDNIHLVVTNNASMITKFYIDGILTDTINHPLGTLEFSNSTFKLGGVKGNTVVEQWPNRMDEVAVYDVELDVATILAHYQAGVKIGSTADYRTLVLSDSPVAYWRLGETSGVTGSDEVGSYDLTHINSPILGEASLLRGDANPSIHYEGAASGQYSTSANISELSSNTISFEAWIQKLTPDQIGSGLSHRLCHHGDYSVGGQRGWTIGVTDGSLLGSNVGSIFLESYQGGFDRAISLNGIVAK